MKNKKNFKKIITILLMLSLLITSSMFNLNINDEVKAVGALPVMGSKWIMAGASALVAGGVSIYNADALQGLVYDFYEKTKEYTEDIFQDLGNKIRITAIGATALKNYIDNFALDYSINGTNINYTKIEESYNFPYDGIDYMPSAEQINNVKNYYNYYTELIVHLSDGSKMLIPISTDRPLYINSPVSNGITYKSLVSGWTSGTDILRLVIPSGTYYYKYAVPSLNSPNGGKVYSDNHSTQIQLKVYLENNLNFSGTYDYYLDESWAIKTSVPIINSHPYAGELDKSISLDFPISAGSISVDQSISADIENRLSNKEVAYPIGAGGVVDTWEDLLDGLIDGTITPDSFIITSIPPVDISGILGFLQSILDAILGIPDLILSGLTDVLNNFFPKIPDGIRLFFPNIIALIIALMGLFAKGINFIAYLMTIPPSTLGIDDNILAGLNLVKAQSFVGINLFSMIGAVANIMLGLLVFTSIKKIVISGGK